MMTKILLADDHPILRKGLKEIIEEETDFQVVAEAGTGEEALSLIGKYLPDIAVLDIDMPKKSGLDVAAEVQKINNPVRVIILTMYDNENILNRALDLGVYGYLLKDNALSEIIDAIKRVNDGKYYITPSLTGHLLKRGAERNVQAEENLKLSLLTPAERKILVQISEGKSSQLIADELFVSLRTVETHRNNICQKLMVHGQGALLKFALINKNRL